MRNIIGLFIISIIATGCDGTINLETDGGNNAPDMAGMNPAPTCADKAKNGNETDIDCGGSCPKCADNQGCNGPADCASGVCTNNKCAPAQPVPNCNDGIKNGNETDIDCGGSCMTCAIGETCNVNADCKSMGCDVAVHLCRPAAVAGVAKARCPQGDVVMILFDRDGNPVPGKPNEPAVMFVATNPVGYTGVGIKCNGQWIDFLPFRGQTAHQAGVPLWLNGEDVADVTLVCAPVPSTGPGDKPELPMELLLRSKCPAK